MTKINSNLSGSTPILPQQANREDVSSLEHTTQVVSHQSLEQPKSESAKKIDPSLVCDIDALKKYAETGSSDTKELIRILEKTGRLSCDYFMPWNDRYHEGGTGYIDGVRPTDLTHSVQWGIDPWKRPFVGIRFTSDNPCPLIYKQYRKAEEAAVIFQRYTSFGPLVVGNHYGRSFDFFPVENLKFIPEKFLGCISGINSQYFGPFSSLLFTQEKWKSDFKNLETLLTQGSAVYDTTCISGIVVKLSPPQTK